MNGVDETIVPKKITDKKTSKYRGVRYHKGLGKYEARITFKGVCYQIGLFDSDVEAAKAYNMKSLEFRGKNAFQNIID